MRVAIVAMIFVAAVVAQEYPACGAGEGLVMMPATLWAKGVDENGAPWSASWNNRWINNSESWVSIHLVQETWTAVNHVSGQVLPNTTVSFDGLWMCKQCPVGTFSRVAAAGITVCEECPLNHVSALGSTSIAACIPCSGLGNHYIGGSQYCLCPAGYMAALGSTTCVPCGEGTYTPSEGWIQCLPCLSFAYTKGTAATACTNCPIGQIYLNKTCTNTSSNSIY